MDWTKLSFKYSQTNSIITSIYNDGKWESLKSQSSASINLPLFSPSLHYGMECFEGLKAFRGADGKVRIFRPSENAARLSKSANFLGIPCPDKALFISACLQAVRENIDYLPPYETRASLYIRPLLITTNPSINLTPQQDGILFAVMVLPVGSYGGGTLMPIKSVIARDYDRAAPKGSGAHKVGGNYAAAMFAGRVAQNNGYKDVLYLNPGEYKFIDEFSSANFFGIRGNNYITPLSPSVLPSITNKSLQQIASDMGMYIQKRRVAVEELSCMDEVGQCGTAVVITPVSQIDDKIELASSKITKQYNYNYEDGCGKISRKLYNSLTAIQYGEAEDRYGWCMIL